MNNTKNVNTLFSLSLLLLFVCCAFLFMMMQIQGYQKMNDDNAYQAEVHTPISYLSNKLKSCDDIEIKEDYLVLKTGRLETYIYLDEGYLKEASLVSGYEMDGSLGEKLFVCDDFTFQLEDSLCSITFTKDGITKELNYTIRKEAE